MCVHAHTRPRPYAGFICQKKNPLRQWLPEHVPLSRLFVETDAPCVANSSVWFHSVQHGRVVSDGTNYWNLQKPSPARAQQTRVRLCARVLRGRRVQLVCGIRAATRGVNLGPSCSLSPVALGSWDRSHSIYTKPVVQYIGECAGAQFCAVPGRYMGWKGCRKGEAEKKTDKYPNVPPWAVTIHPCPLLP